MKKLTRDGIMVWATGQHADDLVAMGWVEVKAPPSLPTPMTQAQRRARWQAREAVQAAETQIWLAREAQRVQDECERADRQWFHNLEQKQVSLDIAIAAREEAWKDQCQLEKTVGKVVRYDLQRQLIEAMALEEKHPHAVNRAEITRLRAELKALYVQMDAR